MKNKKQTIRKIVAFLNNPEEDGGFWLPNIQRPFVWREDQICRLFDSIMREYPISTLLIWKTKSTIRRRKFIDNWKSDLRLSDFYVPEDDKKKCLVLDGQQRLQSLFIALRGSYDGQELYFNILSGEVAAPDDIKYEFSFLTMEDAKYPWVRFKDLVNSNKKNRQLFKDIETLAGTSVSEADAEKIEEHLELVTRTFKLNEAISYQELDSIDNAELYSEEDVVEVFIRANSGGTRLGKSDLLFSLLSASWEVADEEMEELLDQLNRHGFRFTRDFVLKTCLVLFGHGARYEVQKFRKPGVRDAIQAEWADIAAATKDVLDYLRGKTYIQCDKALPSYLVLIPLIYLRFHNKSAWKSAKGLDQYILRTSLAGAFSGNPDRLIDALVNNIKEKSGFETNEIFGVIRGQQRSLELTEDRFWTMGYGSDAIHLLFNLWYKDFNYTPAYENNVAQIDHIFPQSQLRNVRIRNPRTGRRDIQKYPKRVRDQLANCMLLSREENGAGGKGATSPDKWFAGKPKEYLELHCIPENPDLWKVDHFNEFVGARKKLVLAKFKHLVVNPSEAT